MRIGSNEYTEVRPNFWVPEGTTWKDNGDYREYWLDGTLILAEPLTEQVK